MSKRAGLIARITAVGAAAVLLSSCGGGGGGGAAPLADVGSPLDQPPIGDPTAAPAIAFTIPAHASLEVARNLPVQVQFSVDIDPASVQPDSIVVEGTRGVVRGSIQLVTGDLLRFFPDEDLPYGDTYRVTLRPGVRDLAGQGRSDPYIFAFRAIEAVPRASARHESVATDCRLHGLEINAAGDGLSLFSDNGSAAGEFRFRRIRGGVPTGAVGVIGTLESPGTFNRTTFDVAENGNAQYAWQGGVDGVRSAFIRQFNRASDSWGELFPLTPDAGVETASIDAEMNNSGGVVTWVENDVGDLENQRVIAGRYRDGTGLSAVSQLGSSTGRKSGLRISLRGPNGVVAFNGTEMGIRRVQASRFTEALGFLTTDLLDASNTGAVHAVQASATGHLYVLFSRVDPANEEQATWMLSVANPGLEFGPPMPLHDDFAPLTRGKMAVGDNGVLTVLYSMAGQDSGVWVRRYTPATGLSAAAEMTGVGRAVSGFSFDGLALQADASGNAVAAAVVGSRSGQSVRVALLPVGRPSTLGLELSDEPDDSPTSVEVRLALEPSGGAFIQWLAIGVRGRLHYELRARRVRPDGSLGPFSIFNRITLSDTAVIADTRLAITREGRGLILYDTLGVTSGGVGVDNINQVLID